MASSLGHDPLESRGKRLDPLTQGLLDTCTTLPALVLSLWAWKRRSARLGRASLAWMLAWLALGLVQRERAQEQSALRASAKPTLFNPLLWREVWQSGDELHVAAVRPGWLGPGDLSRFFALVTGGEPLVALPPQVPKVVADSVSGFSGTQGAHGWFYGYWDRSADADPSYNQATDFQWFRHFGRDPINGLSGHPEFTTGELWNLEDGVYYTSLWARGGHAHGAMKLGDHAQAEQWAVRRWVSTMDGAVTVTGHAGKVMPWGKNWSGGVKALIVVDGITLFSADIEDGGEDYSLDAVVRVGSLVDFLIGPNPSIGVIELTATLRTAPTSPR